MAPSPTAAALVEQLNLAPHPEGGWYRETWRAPDRADGRAGGTAILFLLKAGERSHWHKVDAEELWFWQGGDPLTLRIAQSDAGPVHELKLGGNPLQGEELQGLVPTGAWQAAEAMAPSGGTHGYSLVSCVVVPGFDFSGFTLADPNWEPGT
ncbi:MAG: cupin domain-containing protein [Pseudomonadota bacterium]